MSETITIELPDTFVNEIASVEQRKILVVDDSAMNRMMIDDILGDDFSLIEAEDGLQAIRILEEQGTDIALMLLDLNMPNLDGIGVLEIMNERGWIQDIPVIVITAEHAYEFVEKTYDLGVTDFIRRPFDARVVHRRIANTVALYSKQRRLVDMVTSQIFENERNTNQLVSILGHIVEFRNGESGLHIMHIGILTEIILQELMEMAPEYGLSSSDRSLIVTASALHDIGKISIDDKVLNKPGRLTDEEYELMKQHTIIGYETLADMSESMDSKLIDVASGICRWHHERWDGKGYPDGLKGEEIPIAAQVVALADVYDALSSERCYKPAYSHDRVMEMILNGECGAFNPVLLECLKRAENRIVEEYENTTFYIDDKREMEHLLNEIKESNDLSILTHALETLECERQKNLFMRELSHELHFEYVTSIDLLNLSRSASQKLGLPETISFPLSNEAFLQVIDKKTFDEIASLMETTTMQDPVVRTSVTLTYDGEKTDLPLAARTVWTFDKDGQPLVESVVGILG